MSPHLPYILTREFGTAVGRAWPNLKTWAWSCFPRLRSWIPAVAFRTAGKAKLSGGTPAVIMLMYVEMAWWKEEGDWA
jgi:hypothetical protein